MSTFKTFLEQTEQEFQQLFGTAKELLTPFYQQLQGSASTNNFQQIKQVLSDLLQKISGICNDPIYSPHVIYKIREIEPYCKTCLKFCDMVINGTREPSHFSIVCQQLLSIMQHVLKI